MKRIDYVLVLVLDMASGHVVGLTKKKGPAFLLNKLTFPGGKTEPGESALIASQRETLEETGLDLPLADFSVFEVVQGADYTLTKVVVCTDKVLYARTMEEEPIWHLEFKHHLQYCLCQPSQYAPDFHSTLKAALASPAALAATLEVASAA